jgi:hypothetical protein
VSIAGILIGLVFIAKGIDDKLHGQYSARGRVWWIGVVFGLGFLAVGVGAVIVDGPSPDEQRLVDALHDQLGGSTECIKRIVERIDAEELGPALDLVRSGSPGARSGVSQETLDALADASGCGTHELSP